MIHRWSSITSCDSKASKMTSRCVNSTRTHSTIDLIIEFKKICYSVMFTSLSNRIQITSPRSLKTLDSRRTLTSFPRRLGIHPVAELLPKTQSVEIIDSLERTAKWRVSETGCKSGRMVVRGERVLGDGLAFGEGAAHRTDRTSLPGRASGPHGSSVIIFTTAAIQQCRINSVRYCGPGPQGDPEEAAAFKPIDRLANPTIPSSLPIYSPPSSISSCFPLHSTLLHRGTPFWGKLPDEPRGEG